MLTDPKARAALKKAKDSVDKYKGGDDDGLMEMLIDLLAPYKLEPTLEEVETHEELISYLTFVCERDFNIEDEAVLLVQEMMGDKRRYVFGEDLRDIPFHLELEVMPLLIHKIFKRMPDGTYSPVEFKLVRADNEVNSFNIELEGELIDPEY